MTCISSIYFYVDIVQSFIGSLIILNEGGGGYKF